MFARDSEAPGPVQEVPGILSVHWFKQKDKGPPNGRFCFGTPKESKPEWMIITPKNSKLDEDSFLVCVCHLHADVPI